MTQIMTASEEMMSDGQIENLVNKVRDAARKHRNEFSLKIAQVVLGMENIGMRLLEPFRVLVEARSNMIVRPGVRVDRTRTPQKMLDDMGRRQYTDKNVLKAMPVCEGDVVDVWFFKPGPELYVENGLMKKEEVARQYELRGLLPDPRAVAAANETDPAFADEKPNAVQWVGPGGQLYYAAFRQWYGGERRVRVNRRERDWYASWWFGGVPASIKKPLDA